MKRRLPRPRGIRPAHPLQEAAIRRHRAAAGFRADDRGSACHRAQAHPEGRVRLHRRGRGSRDFAGTGPTSVPRHRVSSRDPARRLPGAHRVGRARCAGRAALRHRPDGIHPDDAGRRRDRRGVRAASAGIPFALSTLGTSSIEDGQGCKPARPQLVSALHVAGPGRVDGVGRSARRGRVSIRCW